MNDHPRKFVIGYTGGYVNREPTMYLCDGGTMQGSDIRRADRFTLADALTELARRREPGGRDFYTIVELPVEVDDVTEWIVTTSMQFEATDAHDAIRQMVAWLADEAPRAGYRVRRITDEGHGMFIDAEKILR